MSDYWHKAWKCPYIAGNQEQRIYCENGTRLCFPDKTALQAFANARCAGKWEKCPIAIVRNDYYDRLEKIRLDNVKKHKKQIE